MIPGTTARDGPGFIKSPGFPMPYPHDLNCTYTVQADAGNVIELDFTSFSIEKSSSCSWDHLSIYDSNQADEDALVGTFCGDDKPTKIFSSGQLLDFSILKLVKSSSITFPASA